MLHVRCRCLQRKVGLSGLKVARLERKETGSVIEERRFSPKEPRCRQKRNSRGNLCTGWFWKLGQTAVVSFCAAMWKIDGESSWVLRGGLSFHEIIFRLGATAQLCAVLCFKESLYFNGSRKSYFFLHLLSMYEICRMCTLSFHKSPNIWSVCTTFVTTFATSFWSKYVPVFFFNVLFLSEICAKCVTFQVEFFEIFEYANCKTEIFERLMKS